MIRKGVILFAAIWWRPWRSPRVLADDEDIQKKMDALSKEVQSLQQQVAQSKEKKSISTG